MKKKKHSQTGPPPEDAYALALEKERKAWQVLLGMPRSDQRYAQALSEWQAAADRISVEAEKLRRQPKA